MINLTPLNLTKSDDDKDYGVLMEIKLEKNDSPDQPKSVQNRRKTFPCHCGKDFNSNKKLVIHQSTHKVR